MVMIAFRLVGDETERLFDLIQLDPQIEFGDLKKEIETVTHIPSKFQEIRFRGGRILTERPLQTAQFGDELVKHTSLPQWTALTGIVKLFAQSKNSEQKKMHFQLANDYVKILVDSKFFLTYADLNQRYQKIHKTLFKHCDRRHEAMQNTVKTFFEKRLMGKKPNFFFADKTEGSRAGAICTIKYQDTIERYYLKTNHDAGRSRSPSRTELDIREFFVYRFLERLGVGATIHFPTSVTGSKSLLYIASREIPEFKTFEEVEQTETDYICYVHPAIQILTIFTVLSIGDCHSENVGVDNNKSPFIVDFYMNRLRVRSLERDLRNHVRSSNKINKRIDEYSFTDRIKIGVDFLKNIEFEKTSTEQFKISWKKTKEHLTRITYIFPRTKQTI